MLQSASRIVVGVFERETSAARAAERLHSTGISSREVEVLQPTDGYSADATGLLNAAAAAGNLERTLTEMGLSSGEARWCEDQLQAGSTLVAVYTAGGSESARETLHQMGALDVQQPGAALARGSDQPQQAEDTAHDRSATLVTRRWDDVRSRYEMIFEQRYGTTDANWDHAEPVYRFAWDAANDPRYRGQPWETVQNALRDAWLQRHPGTDWQDVEGGAGDVWEDVADDARSGTEGGEQRNTREPFDANTDEPSIQAKPGESRQAA